MLVDRRNRSREQTRPQHLRRQLHLLLQRIRPPRTKQHEFAKLRLVLGESGQAPHNAQRMKSAVNDTSVLEDALGATVQTRDLLEHALTPSSYAREAEAQSAAGGIPVPEVDNEQLEFLGDAVL